MRRGRRGDDGALHLLTDMTVAGNTDTNCPEIGRGQLSRHAYTHLVTMPNVDSCHISATADAENPL